ncbi:MAG: transposase domain-containing protein [Chloroflexota bacterium]
MRFSTMTEVFDHIGPSFSLAPFAEILQPLIDEALVEQGLDRFRQGTLLMPKVLIWLVLALTIRRDLNCQKVFNWMLSGFRWLKGLLPAQAKLVAEGTISHARVNLFRLLFAKLTASFPEVPPDFHGWVSVAFDGSTGTMPDSEPNQKNSISRPQAGVRPLFPKCGWSVC